MDRYSLRNRSHIFPLLLRSDLCTFKSLEVQNTKDRSVIDLSLSFITFFKGSRDPFSKIAPKLKRAQKSCKATRYECVSGIIRVKTVGTIFFSYCGYLGLY